MLKKQTQLKIQEIWLKKEVSYVAIKDIRNLFRLEKKVKAIKYKLLR